MDIIEQITDDITIIEVKGRIDGNTAKAFGEQITGLIKAGRARLLVDLTHLICASV